MKITPHQTAPTRGMILKILAVLAALVVCAVLVLGVTIYRMFSIDGDMKSVRQEVFSELGVSCTGRVELGVPSVLLGMARLAVPFVPVPPEAKLALEAVRGGDVGVYQLADPIVGKERQQLVQRVTGVLAARDWERTVTVLDRDATVLVFTPALDDSIRRFSAFVMVIDRQEMVLVQGHANLEPLFELVEGELAKHGRPALSWQ